MFESFPARRDPRLLLIEVRGKNLVYVALDAFEVRSLGFIARGRGRGLHLACARLLLQVRPSQVALVGLPRALHAKLVALARTRGIALLRVPAAGCDALRRAAPPISELAEQYRELRRLPTASLSPSIRLASALFATRSPSLHRYYVSGLSTRAAPDMDV